MTVYYIHHIASGALLRESDGKLFKAIDRGVADQRLAELNKPGYEIFAVLPATRHNLRGES